MKSKTNQQSKKTKFHLKATLKKKPLKFLNSCFVLASDGGADIPSLGNKWNVLRNQRITGENKTDQEKINFLLNLMKELKGEERKCIDYLALALAKDGKLIWSFEDIYDSGYIIEKPSNKEIPTGKWMSFVWFYPRFQKVYTDLNQQELSEVRKQGNKIKENLQQVIKTL